MKIFRWYVLTSFAIMASSSKASFDPCVLASVPNCSNGQRLFSCRCLFNLLAINAVLILHVIGRCDYGFFESFPFFGNITLLPNVSQSLHGGILKDIVYGVLQCFVNVCELLSIVWCNLVPSCCFRCFPWFHFYYYFLE